jgi:phosphoacetylglucosamine mutase
MSPELKKKFESDIRIGIVCTGYSNGAFMNYITKTLGLKLIIARTGVKFLHREAKEFDISIYFESNGHGTVFSQEHTLPKITKLNSFCNSATDSQLLEFISLFLCLFNRTTGDSLAIFNATECCLNFLNMTTLDFYNIYTELPAINYKLEVKNKTIFLPNEDETRLIEPKETQSLIDEVCSKYTQSRCFIRPSGTEDVIRIYAEAQSLNEANEIIEIVKKYILDNYS